MVQKTTRIPAVDGICPMCRASLPPGAEFCREVFEEVLAREFNNPAYAQVHLLTVDAYVLQHTEEHGPRSNAFHLVRLCRLLEGEGKAAAGAGIPRVRRQEFEKDYRNFPEIPAPPDRGPMTIMPIFEAADAKEHAILVRQWARAVWDAYAAHHAWARGHVHLLNPA